MNSSAVHHIAENQINVKSPYCLMLQKNTDTDYWYPKKKIGVACEQKINIVIKFHRLLITSDSQRKLFTSHSHVGNISVKIDISLNAIFLPDQ